MPIEPGFVRCEKTRFTLNGRPYPAVGVNCYFLGYCTQPARLAVMAEIRRMGAGVIRAWAFHDADEAAPGVFQYGAGGGILWHEGPLGLERLDGLIADAEEQGFRLILPLVNYWPDFGGMAAYLRWLGIQGGADAFYRAPAARDAYRNRVLALLTRRNTRTGRLYLDEPAIMAWELANEPRCEVRGGRALLEWAEIMSRFIKATDTNHLLAVGDEGFLPALVALPDIDFGTCHFYAGEGSAQIEAGEKWIAEHLALGERAGKPMLLEEYGAAAANRDRIYARWLAAVRAGDGAGALLWMVGGEHPEVARFRDRYTVLSADEVPSLAAHARDMQA